MKLRYRENNSSISMLIVALTAALLAAAGNSATLERHRLEMDQVHWSIRSDQFLCELELAIEQVGRLGFYHAAGGELELIFVPQAHNLLHAEVALMAPPWLPQARAQSQPLKTRERLFYLAGDAGRALFEAVGQGLWIELRVNSAEILIPTVGWLDRVEPFQLCRKQLPPMSVRQARDQVLFYRSGQRQLSEAQLEIIEILSNYLKADKKVRRVLIDAYTDDLGSRAGNLQISRERAADVAAALISSGVSPKIIEQRYHGDRYPSAENHTPSGRDLNRKVTIRVIRHDSEK